MLELAGVTKIFYLGTSNEKRALDGVDLRVEAGEFVTVIGSNGAGKSTLFQAIGGAFMTERGRIFLDGQELTRMKEHKRSLHIGRLFQDTMKGTAPHMTIEENLALAYTRKAGRGLFAVNKKDRAYFKELVSRLGLGLEDRLKSKVGQLSGGQRQAISLLMATVASPKLLLLDEHTAALDPVTAEKILQLTVELVEQSHTTTMMITHDMEAALRLGSRTVMMDEGKIILDVKGEERDRMTVQDLLACYEKISSRKLTNDRMLLS